MKIFGILFFCMSNGLRSQIAFERLTSVKTGDRFDLLFVNCSVYAFSIQLGNDPVNLGKIASYSVSHDHLFLSEIINEKPFVNYTEYYLLTNIEGVHALVPSASINSLDSA
jgi:hypothetical protein